MMKKNIDEQIEQIKFLMGYDRSTGTVNEQINLPGGITFPTGFPPIQGPNQVPQNPGQFPQIPGMPPINFPPIQGPNQVPQNPGQFPQIPGMPPLPDMSKFPNIPGTPPLPDMSKFPNIPGIPPIQGPNQVPPTTGQFPGLPPLPDMSKFPQIPVPQGQPTQTPTTPQTQPSQGTETFSDEVNKAQTKQFPLPAELKSVADVKRFQNWMDTQENNWVKKYGKLESKLERGWGKFGPNTKKAWERRGQDYIKSLGSTQQTPAAGTTANPAQTPVAKTTATPAQTPTTEIKESLILKQLRKIISEIDMSNYEEDTSDIYEEYLNMIDHYYRSYDENLSNEEKDEMLDELFDLYQTIDQDKELDDKQAELLIDEISNVIEMFEEGLSNEERSHETIYEDIHGSVEKVNLLLEAEYQGRKVQLGKIMQGDVKKFKVYVKNDKGKVVKVNFGFGGKSAKGKRMPIRKRNPERRKSFRARHRCDNPGPRWKPRYWACRTW